MVKQRSRKKNSKSDIQSSQMSKTCVHHDHFDFMMINLMANDDDDDVSCMMINLMMFLMYDDLQQLIVGRPQVHNGPNMHAESSLQIHHCRHHNHHCRHRNHHCNQYFLIFTP